MCSSDSAGNGAQVRPPGHHAGVKQAMGFCLHNNAAIAAFAAQAAGAKKVLILDWISKRVGTKSRSTPTKNRTATEKPRQPSSSEKRRPPGSQSKRQNRGRETKVISNNRETKGNLTTSRNQTGQQKTPRGEQGQKCPNPQGHQQPNNTQGGAPHQRSRQETNQTAQPKPDQK
ncbi:hypothetical protein LXL04_003002 [Taraxacum kok-saghyz]